MTASSSHIGDDEDNDLSIVSDEGDPLTGDYDLGAIGTRIGEHDPASKDET